jgi:uncharacterized protein YhdP
MRSLLSLKRKPSVGWAVDKGSVRFDTAVPVLPAERIVMVRGRVNQLDLPAYAVAWQRLRQDSLPTIRAQVRAEHMLVGDRRYDEVSLQAERTNAGTNLLLDSAAVAGIVRWPTPAQPAELHFTRLDLPDGSLPGDDVGLLGALAPSAALAVDELNWRGHSLGRLTASMSSSDKVVSIEDARLVSGTHDAHGALHCQTAMPTCRLTFTVESTDAAATLEDFGFNPDLTAGTASLSGELQWHPAPGQPWLAGVQGNLSMRLADGSLRPAASHSADASESAANVQTREPSADAAVDAADARHQPFALLAVPALVNALDAPGAAGASLTKERPALHFDRLEADFDVTGGQATTSNLHFDGDAEILMRGRIGMVSRDYDQQVWLLRGEERLPAAVRRFGATPRVAAAWLSLRDLLSGGDSQDRSRAVLRLQGTWDDPMVVTAN